MSSFLRRPRRSNNSVVWSALLCTTAVALSAFLTTPVRATDPGGDLTAFPVGTGATADGVAVPATVDGVPVLDGADNKVDRMAAEADARLQKLSSGALPNADVSAYKSDLDEMAALQRDIHLLTLKTQKAELATALWEMLYGREQEEEASKSSKDKAGGEQDSASLQPDSAASPVVDPEPVQAKPPAKKEPPEPVLPVIVSLTGVGDAVSARLLVPYKGEVTAKTGDVLPNGMKVVSVSSSGVVVAEGRKKWALGYGDSVPSSPPDPNRAVGPDGLPVFGGTMPIAGMAPTGVVPGSPLALGGTPRIP